MGMGVGIGVWELYHENGMQYKRYEEGRGLVGRILNCFCGYHTMSCLKKLLSAFVYFLYFVTRSKQMELWDFVFSYQRHTRKGQFDTNLFD